MIRSEWSTMKKLMVLKGMTGRPPVEDTATGNPLTFITDLARPLKSLLIPFTPKQTGSGDPSPSNIRPIVPWDELTVKHGGKNLLNPAWLNFDGQSVTNHGVTFTKNADGSITANGTADGGAQVYFNVTSQFDGDYYICDDQLVGSDIDIFAYNSTAGQRVRKWDGTSQSDAVTSARRKAEVKLNSGDSISINLRVYNGRTVNNVTFKPMLVSGTETDFTYEPFEPITETDIFFPSPVYGGEHEAVSGRLASEWAEIASYNGETLPGEWLSDRDVYQAGTTPTIGAQVVYKLATPQEITLTPEQITALVGNNTIWSDADGSMTAVYLKKR